MSTSSRIKIATLLVFSMYKTSQKDGLQESLTQGTRNASNKDCMSISESGLHSFPPTVYLAFNPSSFKQNFGLSWRSFFFFLNSFLTSLNCSSLQTLFLFFFF